MTSPVPQTEEEFSTAQQQQEETEANEMEMLMWHSIHHGPRSNQPDPDAFKHCE